MKENINKTSTTIASLDITLQALKTLKICPALYYENILADFILPKTNNLLPKTQIHSLNVCRERNTGTKNVVLRLEWFQCVKEMEIAHTARVYFKSKTSGVHR